MDILKDICVGSDLHTLNYYRTIDHRHIDSLALVDDKNNGV